MLTAVLLGVAMGLMTLIVALPGHVRAGSAPELALLPIVASPQGFDLLPIGQDFSMVTVITNAGDDRLFVGQRTGEIFTLEADGTQRMFLDLSAQVVLDGGEYGLYDVDFHPDFAGNGFLFVTYSQRIDSKVYLILSRFHLLPGQLTVQLSSEAVLLRLRQNADLHKGGGLDFDRRTNWLYLGIGDDTDRALPQDAGSLKGKVVRVAVDEVPPDLTGSAEGRATIETWALGFRNPWRLDVDEISGLVYVADVGSGSWEEVNAASTEVTGTNFGWPCREGAHFFPPGNDVPECRANPTLTDPLFAFSHDDGRCAIIGGSVYRPLANPGDGRFIFGDLCTRQIFALRTGNRPADPDRALGVAGDYALLTLGEDSDHELYAGNGNAGSPIYKLSIPAEGAW